MTIVVAGGGIELGCASEAAAAVVCLLGLAPFNAGRADTLGNAREGHAYAQEHCAECHGVEPGDVSPELAAPPFAEVARTPGMTERALSVWLVTSHPTMPNFIIPDTVRDDLIAYIMGLKAAPAQ